MDKLQLGNNGNWSPHRAATKARGLRRPHIVGMIPDMENLPARYRLSAEQCQRRADAAVNKISKATWLRFAEEWLKLANEAELSAWRAPAGCRRALHASGSANQALSVP
jgi:hypothetical protein